MVGTNGVPANKSVPVSRWDDPVVRDATATDSPDADGLQGEGLSPMVLTLLPFAVAGEIYVRGRRAVEGLIARGRELSAAFKHSRH